MIDAPQAQVAGRRADDARTRIDRQADVRDRRREAQQQPEPHERQRDVVRQQLMIEVDPGQRDQRPGQEQRRGRVPHEAELPRDQRRQNRGREFDERIARGNLRAAVRALAVEQQVADDRECSASP